MLIETPLKDVDRMYFQMLKEQRVPEGQTLEYKEVLNIESKGEKREICRDACAMANAIGGRIIYGLREEKLEDGSTVAGEIIPMCDGALVDRYVNVLTSSVRPRLRLDINLVSVDTGHIMVVDVHGGEDVELYKVQTANDNGYYIRCVASNQQMTEVEIRRRYFAIEQARRGLAHLFTQSLSLEKSIRKTSEESIAIIPQQYCQNLIAVDVCTLTLRKFAHNTALDDIYSGIIVSSSISGRGLVGSTQGTAEEAHIYYAIHWNGLIYLSRKLIGRMVADKQVDVDATERLLTVGLALAYHVYRECGYRGQVSLKHAYTTTHDYKFNGRSMRAGTHEHDSEIFYVTDIPKRGADILGAILERVWYHGGVKRPRNNEFTLDRLAALCTSVHASQ